MIEVGLKLLSWWATAWVHAALMLLIVYLIERGGYLRAPALREAAWRLALLAPLLTATVQTAWVEQPWAGRPTLSLAAAEEATRLPAQAAGLDSSRRMLAGLEYQSAAPLGAQIVAADDWLPTLPTVLAFIGWAWMLFAIAASGRLLWHWHRERRRVLNLPAVAAEAVSTEALSLFKSAGLDTLSLRRDANSASPAALSPATICLPPWALQQLGPQQRQAMLAHEIAHLQRRDPDWRLACALRACVLWVPLTAIARRRLDELAEHACDAWSARNTGNGRALAEALAVCAEFGYNGREVSAFAAPMAQPRSALVERVQRLIEEQPMQFERLSTLRRVLLSSALLAGVVALPGLTIVDSALAGIVLSEKEPPPPPPPPPAPPAPPAPPLSVQAPAPPVAPLPPPAPPQPARPTAAVRVVADPPPAPPEPPVAPAAPAPPVPPTPPSAPVRDGQASASGSESGTPLLPPTESLPSVRPFRELRPTATELFVSPFSDIERPDAC
jgi:beta-lactamase regulating signal transducer with metallopeptidase domain